MAPTDLWVRAATREDLPQVAEVMLRSRAAAPMPPWAHPPGAVRSWVAGWDLSQQDVWVAEGEAGVVGFARATPTWLDDLYVAPSAQRTGTGSMLLELVKSQRPGGFSLWVFVSNAPARAFYRAHGLLEVETTDGSANEEGAPDVRAAWPGVPD